LTEPASPHRKRFISEAITPVETSFESSCMSAGEPGLPLRFVWRGAEYQVTRVVDKWKTTGPCSHGSGEQYVRRHWYRVQVAAAVQMDIYFDRQPRFGNKRRRWWLAAIHEPTEDQ